MNNLLVFVFNAEAVCPSSRPASAGVGIRWESLRAGSKTAARKVLMLW